MLVRVFLPLMVLCALSSVTCTETSVPPPDRSYNILIMLPCTSKSHLFYVLPLAKALAERGHQLTIVDNMAGKTPYNIENITFVYHNLSYTNTDKINFFEIGSSYFHMATYAMRNLYLFAGEFYDIPEIARLYEEKDKFDLVIVDQFSNEVAYPFAHGKPYISTVITGLEHLHSGVVGNFLNPAYNSHTLDHFKLPMSFLTRVYNFMISAIMPVARYVMCTLPVQIQISRRFPELPSLMDIERTQSLSLLNSHSSIFGAAKLLPTQIEIGGIICEPGKPLPKDLADFLAGDEPAIYVSFGSALAAKFMPQSWRKKFFEALYSLPYKIVWKFDEDVPNLPKNIFRANWMPQQDVLAHPNVKLFISHGGLLGIYEAICHNTLIVALPIMIDQPKHCHRLHNHELGVCIEWNDMTSSMLTETVLEMLHNEKYANKVEEASRLLKDQLETPLDRAVYWTEYVVRHKGAPHLRSPELDLNWVQLLNLDVLATYAVMFYAIYRFYKLLRTVSIAKSKSKTD